VWIRAVQIQMGPTRTSDRRFALGG